ncbi:MAG: ABC transporter substrate-binding protein [Zetaproteobacteria bacterium]|nr:MAG: ABC transporter substrate-binding protein [Zetaproteobacteria bacterium]
MTLDPRFGTDAASERVQRLVHCRLVARDARFRPRPALAARWTHPASRIWRFQLRRGRYFHDGSEVTADDVAATLRYILEPAHASPLRMRLAAIRRIAVEDRYTLRIELSDPDASLLSHLDVGILPASLARRPALAGEAMVGCGPARVRSWRDDRLDLETDRAVLRFVRVKDPVTRALKLARGELDLIQNDLPPYLLPYLTRQADVRLASRTSTTFSYIGFNLRDPVLRDVRVRQALAMALDRALLKRALFADLPRLAETVLAPMHWASVRLAPLPFAPRRAEQLLDRAGYPRGKDGVRFRLTYRTSADPLRLRLAQALAAMWRRIGVRVTIESMEWGAFYTRIKQGDFQLYGLSWVGVHDPDIYRWILHSRMWPPAGANRGRYANAEVDAWLDEALRSEDMTRRKALYARVIRAMRRDMVYIPLWFEPVVAVYRADRLGDYTPEADGGFGALLRLRPTAPQSRHRVGKSPQTHSVQDL